MAIKKQVPTTNYGMYVESSSRYAKEVHESLMEIMAAPYCDESTKRLAITVLGAAMKSQPISISHCSISMDKETK